jgi:hypothetical protein
VNIATPRLETVVVVCVESLMALRLSHFAELIARPGGSVKFGESFFERPLISGPGAIVVPAQA